MKLFCALLVISVAVLSSATPTSYYHGRGRGNSDGFGSSSGSQAGANAQTQTFNHGGGQSGSAASSQAQTQTSQGRGFGSGLRGSASGANAQAETFNQGRSGVGGFAGFGGLSGSAANANAQTETESFWWRIRLLFEFSPAINSILLGNRLHPLQNVQSKTSHYREDSKKMIKSKIYSLPKNQSGTNREPLMTHRNINTASNRDPFTKYLPHRVYFSPKRRLIVASINISKLLSHSTCYFLNFLLVIR